MCFSKINGYMFLFNNVTKRGWYYYQIAKTVILKTFLIQQFNLNVQTFKILFIINIILGRNNTIAQNR